MTIRTTRTVFSFKLTCFDKAQPAVDYQLEAGEELIEGVSMLAYRRIATLLHVRHGSGTEACTVDPRELEPALRRDQQG
jgi:hypothetical protein